MVFTIEERHEGVRAQGEFAGGIVSHSVFLPRVIAYRWGDGGIAVDGGAYPEKVGDNRVDGSRFFESPGDSGSVVAPGDRGVPCPFSTHQGENCFVKDEGCKFQVRVGDTSIGVIPSD